MPLIKNGREITDPWIAVENGAALPSNQPALISLDRWRGDHARLTGRNAPIGIRLASDESPEEIADDLARFGLIALEFSKFTDGRAYSAARILRERYGYRGELCAVGNVLRDQLLFMRRCGFDAFDMDDEQNIEDWRAAISEIDLFYQPAADTCADPLRPA